MKKGLNFALSSNHGPSGDRPEWNPSLEKDGLPGKRLDRGSPDAHEFILKAVHKGSASSETNQPEM